MSDYTNKHITRGEWGLIQDAILDQIAHLKAREQWRYEEEVERFETILKRVGWEYSIAPTE